MASHSVPSVQYIRTQVTPGPIKVEGVRVGSWCVRVCSRRCCYTTTSCGACVPLALTPPSSHCATAAARQSRKDNAGKAKQKRQSRKDKVGKAKRERQSGKTKAAPLARVSVHRGTPHNTLQDRRFLRDWQSTVNIHLHLAPLSPFSPSPPGKPS